MSGENDKSFIDRIIALEAGREAQINSEAARRQAAETEDKARRAQEDGTAQLQQRVREADALYNGSFLSKLHKS